MSLSNDKPLENIEKKKKYITKIKNLEKKYKNITKEVTFNPTDIKYNTPTIIIYDNKKYNIVTRDYYDKLEYTWKCEYFRRIKDKPEGQTTFCSSSIKGIKTDIFKNNISFYLKCEHSSICKKIKENNKFKTHNKAKTNNIDANTELESSKKKNHIIDNINNKLIECKNAEDIDKLVLEQCKINKEYLKSLYIFQKTFEKLYIT